jgi:hypothetical protein
VTSHESVRVRGRTTWSEPIQGKPRGHECLATDRG